VRHQNKREVIMKNTREKPRKISWIFASHGEAPPDLKHNELALDVGSPISSQIRLFDHHSSRDDQSGFNCSASVLLSRINELNPLKKKDEVIIFCHPNPDADCAVSSFLAVCYLNGIELNNGYVSRLLDIDGQIDQGRISPLSFDSNYADFNFYTFFLLMDDFIKEKKIDKSCWDIVKDYVANYGLDLENTPDEKFIAYSFALLMQLHENSDLDSLAMVQSPYRNLTHIRELDDFLKSKKIDKQLKVVFRKIAEFIKVTLQEGRDNALKVFNNQEYEAFTVTAPKRLDSTMGIEVTALYVKLPFTALPFVKSLRGVAFDFVQNQKIEILAFAPTDDTNRVVISVNPNADVSLKGLGLALDRNSTEKKRNKRLKPSRYWKKSNGEELPDPLFPYQDPWYDGRGFDYTIVDAPSNPDCRFIKEEEIIEILGGNWFELAKEYETPGYQYWKSLPDK
jgi:hypothetical protein